MKKFIVLDVEGLSTQRPYNIGYIVADKHGTIYKARSAAIPEAIWENIQNAVNSGIALDITKQNIQEILTDFAKKTKHRKYKYYSIQSFYNVLEKDIGKYKIKEMYAYNVSFDKGALKRLFGDVLFDTLKLEYRDIITGILETKLKTEKYCNFCIANGYITEKRNIMTKAEIVYRYLTNTNNFQEEHTGLADVLIEYEILLACLKQKKKQNFKPCQAWRILKDFCEERGIEIP